MLTLAKDGGQAVHDAALPMAGALIILGLVGIVASFLIKQAQPASVARAAEKPESEKSRNKAK